MIKAGIIGVTGYTGAELVRLLQGHPDASLLKAASRSGKDSLITDNHKHFYKKIEIVDSGLDDPQAFVQGLDVVFLALPHGTASEIVKQIKGKVKIIDLSADFRLKDLSLYEKWYGVKHSCPEYFSQAVYGLPEVYRKEIRGTDLVANPGCYPTSILLALYPLLKSGLLEAQTIIADSKSGVSGAGKKAADHTHFPEMNENFYPYSLGKHRHTPEIAQEIGLAGKVAGQGDFDLVFSPHLLPINRGILSTIYVDLKEELDLEALYKIYENTYEAEPFIRIRRDVLPQTKLVAASNFCDIGLAWSGSGKKLIIVSAIDNLIKGASGQAIQNMNIIYGLPEERGLDTLPIYP